jgi:SecD/SecF fusion protein
MNLTIFFVSFLFLIFFIWYLATTNERTRRLTAGLQMAALTVICLLSLFATFGPAKVNGILGTNIQPGLDLKGGSQFTIQLAGTPSPQALDQAVEVIRKRIDAKGVAEPLIQPAGDNRILVQIPGIDEELKQTYRAQLERVAKLEFRMVHPKSDSILSDIKAGGVVPVGYEVLPYRQTDLKNVVTMSELVVKRRAAMSGRYVRAAARSFTQLSQPEVIIYFTSEGSDLFGQTTKNIIDESALEGGEGRMAIVLDGEVYSAPGFRDNRPIYGDSCVISGGFTATEAEELASVLENPLETPVSIVDERGVDPSLGKASVQDGFRAGLIGLVAVIVFMLIYYHISGLFAVVALMFNMLVLLGLLAQLGFTLTLPGIAGIVLTIGMAVDANVLIFERIREELASGNDLRSAIGQGFSKAFSSIMDANVTTLIAAVIMFWQGTGAIQGFAITLCLGIVSSVFSAIIVTRTCFDWLLFWKEPKTLTMLSVFSKANWDFMKVGKLALTLSILAMIASAALWVQKGDKVYGVDFLGGDLMTLSFKDKVPDDQVRSVLGSEVAIQFQTSAGSGEQVLSLRTPFNEAEAAESKLMAAFPSAGFERQSLDKVQAVIGQEFKEKAILALVLGIAGIFVYVFMRFEFSFAVGAIVALIHDVIVTLGLFTLLGKEFSLITVGAILTLAGYSINDTIVTFDRIRETLKKDTRTPMADVLNAGVNATLSRTFLTAGTTLIAVFALYLFGGLVIHEFSFILLAGVIIGTYSSVFIAAPIVLLFGERTRKAMSKHQAASELA